MHKAKGNARLSTRSSILFYLLWFCSTHRKLPPTACGPCRGVKGACTYGNQIGGVHRIIKEAAAPSQSKRKVSSPTIDGGVCCSLEDWNAKILVEVQRRGKAMKKMGNVVKKAHAVAMEISELRRFTDD